MRVLILGQAGAGKTRWAVSQLTRVKKIDLMERPVMFYSETGAINIKRIAQQFKVSLDGVEIDEYRPSLSDFQYTIQQGTKTIIVDHLMRIKGITKRKVRDDFTEMIERSEANWCILAHTLKGVDFDYIDVDSGKYTSGIAAVVDIVLGIGRHYDRTLLKVLKDRQYDFKGFSLFRWDINTPIINWRLPNKR